MSLFKSIFDGICEGVADALSKYSSDSENTEWEDSDNNYTEREDRFPDIDWICDMCGALLNEQDGFDDHKYVWKCKECGYKNSISSSNIFESEEDYKNHRKI